MKMAQILKTKEGKWSLWKLVPVGSVVAGLILFTVNTSYQRYSWMRDQCYKVATNESYLKEAKKNLDDKDTKFDQRLDDLKAELKKSDGIIHGRMSKETDKRERGDERLLNLILDMLDQQQRTIKQQQDMLEQKAKP